MTRITRGGSIALAVLIAASPAAAQTNPERIRDLVKTGQKVTIVDDEGRDLEGRVETISPGTLALLTPQGRLDLPLERIVRIDHPRDGLGNGALIGMGTLVGLTWLGWAVVDHSCSPDAHCSGPSGLVMLWASGSMAAFGAGLGVAVDALIQRRDQTIYRRGSRARATVGPAIGHGVRGAVVSVSW
jgi:hypothetical protein